MSTFRNELTPTLLKELYLEKNLSTYKIASLLRCDPKTVWNRLRKYNLKTRPVQKKWIAKEILFDLYINKKFSLKKIGKIHHMSASGILKRARKLKILTRTSWETNTGYKKPFLGPLAEKAYLIGFRLGDLGVRMPSSRTKLVLVGSNTTKREQAVLIKQLFDKYSKVWTSQSESKTISVSTLLHQSFNFLVPKEDAIERWISDKRKLMYSFIAGYVDAEGSFGIYNNRGRFRLGSYDRQILDQIHHFFLQERLRSTLSLERKKRKGQNKDFWRLIINEAVSLNMLFNRIYKLLRHRKRKTDFERVAENVYFRLNNGRIRQ